MSRRDEGSIFVEAMIAAAVVAVMLGGLYQAIAASAQRHRMSDDRRVALLVAQSQMAAAGVEFPLAQGRTSGLAGEYLWQVEVSDHAAGSPESAVGRPALVVVTVRERDAAAPLVTLRSLRLAPQR